MEGVDINTEVACLAGMREASEVLLIFEQRTSYILVRGSTSTRWGQIDAPCLLSVCTFGLICITCGHSCSVWRENLIRSFPLGTTGDECQGRTDR